MVTRRSLFQGHSRGGTSIALIKGMNTLLGTLLAQVALLVLASWLLSHLAIVPIRTILLACNWFIKRGDRRRAARTHLASPLLFGPSRAPLVLDSLDESFDLLAMGRIVPARTTLRRLHGTVFGTARFEGPRARAPRLRRDDEQ